MPTIKNLTAAALGLYDTDSEFHVLHGIGGTATLTPDMQSQEVVDLYKSVGAIEIDEGTAPENLTVPSISGIMRIGQTITANPGTWSGNPAPTFKYQWQKGTVDVAGATNKTYVLIQPDAGLNIRVVVTATNDKGSATANSAPTTAITQIPSNTAFPAITGTPQVGKTLTVGNGTWTAFPAPTYTRQWKADGVNISGATATTYIPVVGDIGKVLTVTVTATNSAGNGTINSVATTPIIAAEE